jgi:hypothetical protein
MRGGPRNTDLSLTECRGHDRTLSTRSIQVNAGDGSDLRFIIWESQWIHCIRRDWSSSKVTALFHLGYLIARIALVITALAMAGAAWKLGDIIQLFLFRGYNHHEVGPEKPPVLFSKV